ncbi:MAG: 30S ribosomal protein S12 methylthiotransferase RimO [Planctomycetota bacterium]|jgi:ribosomal protein S12 methylthiotransferase
MTRTASSVRGRIALVSLGCAKNLADSEGLVERLEASGFALAETLDAADLALVNTCGFIDPAKEESIETILGVARRKEYGRLRGLIVAGCLVERYLDRLQVEIPEVDRWLPFRDYPRIVEAAEDLMGLPQVRPLPSERVLLTPAPYAYLKISEGCDQKCTFCAIPSFRGRLVSRTIEENVADARRIAARGVAEINIVSQDTTAYGRDLYGTPRLGELLRRLTEVEGPDWWRVLYLYPSILRDDVLEEMARNEKIVKYVDLPLQHVTDEMLRRMRRGISAERQRALLARIRASIPDVVIRTTLISGFPGETEADHRALLASVASGMFDRLGVFTFSREEGTPSYAMPDPVPTEIAEARRAELMAAQQAVHFAWNQERVGRSMDVLVESVDPFTGTASGRTAYDAPDVDAKVRIRDARHLTVGKIAEVRITGSDGYDLEASSEGVE